MTEISVVIPSYNHPKKIQECVKSILSQNYSKAYEVIIVDSSPIEKQTAVENALAAYEHVRLIKLKKQTYPGAARNIGVQAAKGNTIALIDSDCIATNNWLEVIDKNIDAKTILAGVIMNGTKDNAFGTCSYLVEFNNFLEFKQAKKEISTAATCNFAVKKDDFLKVGGFTDDRAFEDFLFCHRFKKAGGTIHQLSDLRIYHLNKTKLKDIAANQKMLGRFSAKVRKKNGMPPKLIFKYPIFALGLPVYRYASMLSRIIKTKHLFKFLLYTPIVVYLLMQWGLGFYLGASEQD